MRIRFFINILLLFLFAFPVIVLATDTLNNVGIIKSGIWYSKDPFFTGDKVRIYTLVFNGSNHDLIGEVVFDVDGKVICKGSFTAVSGKTQEVWCDWTAVSGTHKISAKIVNSKLAPVGEAPYAISLENNISGISERVVTNPPKIELVVESKTNTTLSKTATSSSDKENIIYDNLEKVKETVTKILPDNLSTEDVVSSGEKIASATPKTIREGVSKILDKVGKENLKKPLMYVLGFLVTVYNFIIGEPVLLIIIAIYLVCMVAKYIRRRLV